MTVAEIAAAGRPPSSSPSPARRTATRKRTRARSRRRVPPSSSRRAKADARRASGDAIAALLADPARLLAMGEAGRRSAKPDAAARLCEIVFEAEATRR